MAHGLIGLEGCDNTKTVVSGHGGLKSPSCPGTEVTTMYQSVPLRNYSHRLPFSASQGITQRGKVSLHVIAWLGFSTVIIVLLKRSHGLIPWGFELELLSSCHSHQCQCDFGSWSLHGDKVPPYSSDSILTLVYLSFTPLFASLHRALGVARLLSHSSETARPPFRL
jgi:hypothetical protein